LVAQVVLKDIIHQYIYRASDSLDLYYRRILFDIDNFIVPRRLSGNFEIVRLPM